jgi:hypothetical protein
LAFFGGGYDGNQLSNVVDIFNSTSQTWNNTTLSQARYQLATSSIGDIVAFGGGWNGSKESSIVDMLNVTSNTWFIRSLSQPRSSLASTSSINKIFFGGGGDSNIVDIFCFDGNCPPPPTPPYPLPTGSPFWSPQPTPISFPTPYSYIFPTPISTFSYNSTSYNDIILVSMFFFLSI